MRRGRDRFDKNKNNLKVEKQSLQEIFKEIGNHSGVDLGGNDKGSTHSYLETYDRLFAPYRNGATILEIGLATGDSIKLWDRYFENSIIVGTDISVVFDAKDIPYNDNGNIIDIVEADATKPEFLDKIKQYEFDVVVEDSSHMEQDSVAIFNLLKPKMKPKSVYIVEDILNLDLSKERFKELHSDCEIIDLRHVKGRFDDCLIVYKF